MQCLCCANKMHNIKAGMRVELSSWEKSMLNKDMVGTVEQLGHPETLRRHTAKVRWDNGHKDQWWPVNMLFPVVRRRDGTTTRQI